MILKSLQIISFGKFRKKEVCFSDKLNLVYGTNEAGKTTMHRFIEGMFFGFFKPYSKIKLYTDAYDKYVPWARSSYKGVLEYEYEGRVYRLERNFDKAKESVKLYDSATGEDITDLLPYDSVQKMPDASKHLGCNSVLFRNTVSIEQLGSPTDENLKKELGDLIANASGALDVQVSFKKAIETIDRAMGEIGTKKQSKSPLGSSVAMLETLKKEHAEAEAVYDENKEKYCRVAELEQQLEESMHRKGDYEALQERADLADALKKQKRLMALDEQIKNLEKAISPQTDCTEEDYLQYQEASAQEKLSAKNLAEAQEKKSRTETQIKWLQKEMDAQHITVSPISEEEILQDSALFDQRMKQLDALKQKQEESADNSFSEQYEGAKRKEKGMSVFGTGLIIAGIICAALGYFVDSALYYAAIASGVAGLALLGLWAVRSTKSSALEREFERYDTTMSRTTNMLVMYEIDIQQLKSKYGCKDTEELQAVLGAARSDNLKRVNYEKQKEGLERLNENLAHEIETLQEEMKTYQTQIWQILEKAGAANAEELKTQIEGMRNNTLIQSKLDAACQMQTEILDKTDRDTLYAKADAAILAGIDEDSEDISDSSDTDENDKILDLTSQIAALKAGICESENAIRGLNEIEEEIETLTQRVETYETDLNAYGIAKERIELLSKDLHGNFAEVFNTYVSDMMREVTRGKYDTVKVSDQMDIKVIDPDQERMTQIDSLSAGTVDQLYFSVRFAMIDLILGEKNVPVFLDDSFLQYDEERLESVLRLLGEKSQDRQIVLMTCRKTEQHILERNNIPFHLIEL